MNTTPSPWKTLSSEVKYRNPWMTVREDKVVRPEGTEGIYGVIEKRPGVYVIALDERDRICMVEQFRYPTQNWSWEVPAGGTDEEDVLTAAKRELWEETGFQCSEIREIGTFEALNGNSNALGHVTIARGLTQTGQHKQLEDGISAVRFVTFTEFLTMVKEEECRDGLTSMAVLKVALELKWLPL